MLVSRTDSYRIEWYIYRQINKLILFSLDEKGGPFLVVPMHFPFNVVKLFNDDAQMASLLYVNCLKHLNEFVVFLTC